MKKGKATETEGGTGGAGTESGKTEGGTGTKTSKFLRMHTHIVAQLEHASEVSGIEQQQLVEDALTLYFHHQDPAALAMRGAILVRLRQAAAAAEADLTKIKPALRAKAKTKPPVPSQ